MKLQKDYLKGGKLIGIDRDNDALGVARKKLSDFTNVEYIHGNHDDIKSILENLKICEYRRNKKIETTTELVEIINASIPEFAKKGKGHPAKKTFQAIRIEVNDEIKPLYNTVINCINALKPRGRLCIITFHSLEDRAVKMAYADALGKCVCPKELPYCVCNKKVLGKIITKKPILPTEVEMENNSRSKSAKLRVFERI